MESEADGTEHFVLRLLLMIEGSAELIISRRRPDKSWKPEWTLDLSGSPPVARLEKAMQNGRETLPGSRVRANEDIEWLKLQGAGRESD